MTDRPSSEHTRTDVGTDDLVELARTLVERAAVGEAQPAVADDPDAGT